MKNGAIIIGAGQAGAQMAVSLRQGGYDLSILLIGDEPYAPYQRPPLSKSYLAGEQNNADLFLKPEAFWQTHNIELYQSTQITKIDSEQQNVQTQTGKRLSYDHLILATGARPRMLRCRGSELDKIFVLRGLTDADTLKKEFQPNRKIIIIGGGYVGLECAATAIKHEMNVTVLEAEERVLARVAGVQLAEFFAQKHKAAGVNIRCQEQAVAFEGTKQVQGVVLASSEVLEADLVLVGIGVLPNQELADQAGLRCQNGILVNEFCQTSTENIYAIGDVSVHPSALYGRNLRLESVQNAIEQAKTAASHILGKAKAYDQVPWFWSDQYDLKLQMAGLHDGYDQSVMRGDPKAGSFAIFYLKDGVLIACDAVNAPSEYMGARILIGHRAIPNTHELQDQSCSMKEIMGNS